MADVRLADLDGLYGPPGARAAAKTLPRLDRHMTRFIGLSPFCVLASVGGDGTVDVSPRGGAPGFVQVADERTLVMPDRRGNNRLDTFRNILSGSGEVSLLFLLPGMDETLRVAGRAELTADPALLAAMVEFGKPPKTALRIAVREAFLHCAKAVMRGRLWEPQAQIDRSVFPSLGEMIVEQTGVGEAETQAQMVARYRETL
ncbi:MAG: pyridoxamine 5'-phosphate oxidase family protein [Caulobacterales bacterium]|nr:pyridoxamine 5'-phosphate oxidase family protein [Caulobacterales bacterium]